MGLYAPDPELYYAARARVDAVQDELARWSSRESVQSSSESLKLVTVLEKGCYRLRDLADGLLTDWKAGIKDRTHLESSIAFLIDSAANLGAYLSIFESREFDGGLPEISLPLTLLLKNVVPAHQDHSFIFFATSDFNFYYQDLYDVLKKPLLLGDPAEFTDFITDLPPHVALVAYSSIERANAATLVILLHELAHYVDKTLKIGANAPAPRPAIAQMNMWLAEARQLQYVPQWLIDEFKSPGQVPADVLDFTLRASLVRGLEAASTWVSELTADLIATRILGIGFFLTLRKFLGFFPDDDQRDYPPHYRRHQAIAVALLAQDDGLERDLDVATLATPGSERHESLSHIIDAIRENHNAAFDSHASRMQKPTNTSTNNEKRKYLMLLARDVIEDAISASLSQIKNDVSQRIGNVGKPRFDRTVVEITEQLMTGISPSQSIQEVATHPPAAYTVQQILNAAWLAWVEGTQDDEKPEDWRQRHDVISRLAIRGIELSHFLSDFKPDDEIEWKAGFAKLREEGEAIADLTTATGVLRRSDLAARLISNDPATRLVVSPISDPSQVGEASLDVRLGNSFLVVSRTRAEAFAVGLHKIDVPASYYAAHKLGLDEHIVLHPGEFVLGSLLEYISVPRDLMAYVIGRSTVGRLGLIIATATHVAPGYKGTLTLELTNVGTVPIRLLPGVKIAQLVFHRVSGAVSQAYSEHGRYRYSVGPEPPKTG